MVERKGRVIAKVVPDVKADTLMPIVADKVLPSSMVFTDDFPVYDRISGMGYKHNRINHSAKVYVAGHVHTQTIEGFWSLLKRGIGGVYHSVSAKFLQTYCDEYAYRYNHRNDPQPMFYFAAGAGFGDGAIALRSREPKASREIGCIFFSTSGEGLSAEWSLFMRKRIPLPLKISLRQRVSNRARITLIFRQECTA